MSRAIELSEDAYGALLRSAQRRGQSPEELLELWIAKESAHEPEVYEDLDEFFRALGMTEDEIAESERIFDEREQAETQAGRSLDETPEDADVRR